MRHDLTVGKFAHFLADRIERFVEAAGADGHVRPITHQLGEPGAARRSVAGGDQMIDGGRNARRHCRRAQSEIGKAHDLALTHRYAAEYLRQKFAGANPHQKFFGLAERARRLKPLGIGGKLPDGFDIRGEPGKSMRSALFAIEHARHRAAFDRHPGCDSAARIGKQRLGGSDCVVQRGVQFIADGLRRYGKRHGGLQRPEFLAARTASNSTRALHKSQRPHFFLPLRSDGS